PAIASFYVSCQSTPSAVIFSLSLHDALPISSGDLQERVLIRHHDYDQCFQSVQLLQWNSQVKFNVTVYRNLPTTERTENTGHNQDRKSGSAGMPRPISYAVFCSTKKYKKDMT